jgi:hypothetical protein
MIKSLTLRHASPLTLSRRHMTQSSGTKQAEADSTAEEDRGLETTRKSGDLIVDFNVDGA